MLVPVQGGVANLQKRNRQIHHQEALLKRVPNPPVYIFNVGSREWRGVGGGKSYTVKPCPPDAAYSEPTLIPSLCISEIDHADGGGSMGVVHDSGLTGEIEIAGVKQVIDGVANDVVGTNSTAAGLELNTTNGQWFGIFITVNVVPTDEELDEARGRLTQMMELIYATGSEKVQTGEKVPMVDRPRYNEAAAYLGKKPLWGSIDHMRATCPECHEDIIEGAHFCKHCRQAIDPASVAARAAKRAKENKKLLSEEESPN